MHSYWRIGPPGQVAAIAGNKAGFKQGELGGILKQLGYTEDQVSILIRLRTLLS
jgi:cytochrome-b5 reductase